ncbi:Cytochrome p450 [Thalictrum thalictroides]|uniref:Cytochrome p450 n=1 Tax=Thalictrum thalictroides TaxID=46969 RepID=A0A7J6VAF5_THATH|nr:Cytochrome p450 [Thalictrum thalictroides]
MELALLISSSICLLVVSLHQFFRRKTRNSNGQLPPGPRGWPLVGNLFDLGKVPHQTLLDLGKKYGPVMWLQFGAMNDVIIQSSKAAGEMFKNHDLTYSGRTVTDAMTACKYHEGSLAFSQYGSYWRTVRRLCITELTVNKRVNETTSLRRKGIDKMIEWIDNEAKHQGGVQIGHFVYLMNFNLIGNLMLSRDLIDPQSAEGPEFYGAMEKLMKAAGQPNVSDFFPFLKWLDPQRVRKKMEDAVGQGIDIVTGFIKERIEEQNSGEQKKRKDFLDILLDYEGEGEGPAAKISERAAVVLILEMFLAVKWRESHTPMNRAAAQILDSRFIVIKSLAPTLVAQERPWLDETTFNSEDHLATVGDIGDIGDGLNNKQYF